MNSEGNPPTTFLHIGTAKTGTTAIQEFIGHNLERFEKAGYYYPETGRVNSCHHGIAFYWGDHAAFKGMFHIGEDHLVKFSDELAAHKDRNIIVSSECFLMPTVDWDELMASLPHQNVKVIVYFRRQDLILAARYREHVKGNRIVASPDQWIEGNFHPNEYLGILDRLQTYVKKEDIIVRLYERRQFAGGSIFSDFCDIFSIPVTDDFVVSNANFNPHLSRDALEFNRLINTVFDHQTSPYVFSSVLTQYTLYEMKKYGSDKREQGLFAPQKCCEVLAKCEEVNRTIAREYLGREDGRLFYDEPPAADESWEPYPGLSEEKAEDIIRFIFENNPQLAQRLYRAFAEAEGSDPYLLEAKRVLLPSLQKVLG